MNVVPLVSFKGQLMDKRKEISSEILSIWKILTYAKECFQYSYYLHKPDTKEEIDYLNRSRDFKFIAHTLWEYTVIQLSKLFSESSKRDRYNISHFISKLKPNGHFGNMKISETIINKWENQIAANQVTINNILTLRDKVYAHTDSNWDDYNNIEITFKQTEQLIEIVETIIFDIYTIVLDTHPVMNTPFFRKGRFNIIKVLADEEKRADEAFILQFHKDRR